MGIEACLDTRPEKVVLLGLGASRIEYLDYVVASNCTLTWDEVWAVNMGIPCYRHDKAWIMDDLRKQADFSPAYGKAIARHDRPIITSTVYPEFPMSVRYPLEKVIEKIGDDYFTNTVAYALGYAMLIGVKEITLFGCDFWYPNLDLREEGSMNAAYLLGMGRYFGMKFKLPQSTTLLSAHTVREINGRVCRPLYGYAKQPFIPEEKKEEKGNGIDLDGGAQVSQSEGQPAVGSKQDDPIRAP